jgi:hypothetical protein
MFNYRLIATLLLLCIIVFPLAVQWALEPDGHWFRPFMVWFLLIFATFTLQRDREGR